MANVSLLELAKDMPDTKAKGAVWTYALETHVTQNLPIANEPSGVMAWDIKHDLAYTSSSAGTRALEGEYTPTFSPTQPFDSNFKIYGGRVQQDRVNKLLDSSRNATEKSGQIRAHAQLFTKDVFEGTGGQYLYGIKGYLDNYSLFSGQTINAGTLSAGAVLSLDMLDEVLSYHNVQRGKTFMYMNNAPHRRIQKMSRGQGGTTAFEAQAIRYEPDEFGVPRQFYGDVQLVPLIDGKGDDMLSNTEGDGSSTTVYIVTYGDENFTGFQVGPMQVYDMQGVSVVEAFDVEWVVGTAAKSKKCISRIRYVKNAVS
jgi:hypothetical protein